MPGLVSPIEALDMRETARPRRERSVEAVGELNLRVELQLVAQFQAAALAVVTRGEARRK